VSSADIPSVRSRLLVSGTLRRSDGVQCRVIADAPPDPAARPADPSLEDAYLSVAAGARKETA
jgi:hypothetical protein